MTTSLYEELQIHLDQLASEDRLRQCRLVSERTPTQSCFQNRSMLNLSSNDYLGLAADRDLHDRFFQALQAHNRIDDFGMGASSSRLLTGTTSQAQQLEQALARAFGRPGALVFNSGYHANVGLLSALLDHHDAIFSDRLNHASIIDGARLSGAKLYRYRHLDLNHLEQLLRRHRGQYRRTLIITESVFSMDGDLADLKTLSDLRDRYQGWLYVDEAHALGVMGSRGLGLAEVQGVIDRIDFLVGTFGKALASVGAFVVADKVVIDFLINNMRPFIYTTALPAINLHWTRTVLDLLPSLVKKREHLAALARDLRLALAEKGLQPLGQSHIVPVLIGGNEQTLAAAKACRENRFLLFAIRPPTVPAGQARLRISLNAALNRQALQPLPALLARSCS